MSSLTALWLPILLSAVTVFIVSSIIHMATPWHKSDAKKLPREDEVLGALRQFSIPPGDYMAPRASSMKEMSSPEFAEKQSKGPVIILTVLPIGPMKIAKGMVLWFLYSVVVSIFAAYIASRAVPSGPYLQVFRFAGATAFFGYSVALMQNSIWYGRSWWTTAKSMIDGFLYALLTAGIFGWLWPR